MTEFVYESYLATFASYNCDQILEIVTLGQFCFIGPAKSYTHTLPIHSVITRFDWQVCFSRASFTDHANSRLRQQDPWRALHGWHGFKIDPGGGETSLRPSKYVWTCDWHFLDSYIASPLVQTVLIKGLTCLILAAHPPTHYSLYVPLVILQQLWKSCSKSSSVS